MKHLLIFLLFPMLAHSQLMKKEELKHYTTWEYYKHDLPSLGAMFVSGMADGLNQTLEFHYNDFQRVFPKANPQYWNPAISWTNKYKYGNYLAGSRFPGSTTLFVGWTDGYHMTRTVEHGFIGAAVFLKLGRGESKKAWQYLLEALSYWAVNRVGMTAVYNIFTIKKL